jgi:hypothetical protein
MENQRALLDKLAIKLNITKPEDWYRVTSKMVMAEGGNFLMSYYKGSLIQGTIVYSKTYLL